MRLQKRGSQSPSVQPRGQSTAYLKNAQVESTRQTWAQEARSCLQMPASNAMWVDVGGVSNVDGRQSAHTAHPFGAE